MMTSGSVHTAAGVVTSGGGTYVTDPPGRPTSLAGTPGDTTVALTWTDPVGGGDKLTGLNVYKATVSGGPYTLFGTAAVGAQAKSVTGLTNSTPYYFVVTGTGPGGEGDRSNEATATPSA